jgi:hypothetical protein
VASAEAMRQRETSGTWDGLRVDPGWPQGQLLGRLDDVEKTDFFQVCRIKCVSPNLGYCRHQRMCRELLYETAQVILGLPIEFMAELSQNGPNDIW